MWKLIGQVLDYIIVIAAASHTDLITCKFMSDLFFDQYNLFSATIITYAFDNRVPLFWKFERLQIILIRLP